MSVQRARELRKTSTDAERKLWSILRNGRLEGYKFRRQQPIRPYIIDFLCFEKMLIVEADGGQHDGSPSDRVRDGYLRGLGYRVLRFWNNDILTNPDGVAAVIVEALKEGPHPSPNSA